MPSPAIDDSALNEGRPRKLNALRKSVGNDIGESAFAERLVVQAAQSPADRKAERVAEALWPPVEQGTLRLPHGRHTGRAHRWC